MLQPDMLPRASCPRHRKANRVILERTVHRSTADMQLLPQRPQILALASTRKLHDEAQEILRRHEMTSKLKQLVLHRKILGLLLLLTQVEKLSFPFLWPCLAAGVCLLYVNVGPPTMFP